MASDSPPGTTGTASVEATDALYPPDWRAELMATWRRDPQEAERYVESLEMSYLNRDRSVELDPDFEPDEPRWMLGDLARMSPHHAEPIIDHFAKPHGDEFQRTVWRRFFGRHDRRPGLTSTRPRDRRARPRERRGRSSRRTRAPAGASDDGPAESPPPLGGHARDIRLDAARGER